MRRSRADHCRSWGEKQGGFTVLEMLVALSLVSLVLGLVVGGLRVGQRAWVVSRLNETRGEVEASGRALRGLVQRIVPVSSVDSQNKSSLVFVGRKNDCLFVAVSDGETQRGGLVLTKLGLESGGDIQRIMLRTRIFRAETAWTTSQNEMQVADVLRDVVAFEISYFGVMDSHAPAQWYDEWMSDRLPQLIAFRFTLLRKGRRFDVPVVAAVRQS